MKLSKLKVDMDYFKIDEKLYQKLKPTPLKNPKLVSFNKKACDLINLDYKECETQEFLDFLNGTKTLENSQPYAMVYAGHQFGYFVPQLGDGRAINLGNINSWHLQTKGSGPTKYSRRGDGRAVLRSSIREYIISEAMYALDIPTTRALAIIDSDTYAHREWEKESCSIVLRMSSSWIRIGTFEFFANTENSKENVTKLADYVIEQNYPHLKEVEGKYEKMFYSLVDKTASMLARWQVYGFMHGVMNTDNFSMAGVTIDYGPFAFMDYFDKNCICNHTDGEGRYSYNNQPYVARWNLIVLANALKEICDESKLLEYMKTFLPQHENVYLKLMNERLGLIASKSGDSNLDLILELLGALETSKMDYNVFFHRLNSIKSFDDLSYITDLCVFRDPIEKWFDSYKKVCEIQENSFSKRNEIMKKVNPKYIIKNYMLQEAIELAHTGDYSLVNDLLEIAQNPYEEHSKYERYSNPTPMKFANIKLSCSS
ncbi:YdiU family protein [Poseidonibacter lekithochrous]|uniref:protein adenylyltransferase SelO n=1 Tax=Poseidonibacter TaxID=2321187 RepID=UPI001C0A0C25|nr:MULTISPECIES: YdiU family protein [Poseidonibacter]MBU3015400.1 YdiU family protein [Poseidonibacter lekithochrous]MDO6828699.1 YdiU family protein [Poseidonibacter sp. 1_MG-2023]